MLWNLCKNTNVIYKIVFKAIILLTISIKNQFIFLLYDCLRNTGIYYQRGAAIIKISLVL